MPELPEVETVVRQLRPKISGQRIKKVIIIDRKLGSASRYSTITNKKIRTVARRGKYIIIRLNDDVRLIIHLRMTGQLLWQGNSAQADKYTRVILRLSPRAYLLLNDLRRFATFTITKTPLNLGIEPLTAAFNSKHLGNILAGSKRDIKDFLLDQKKIAGIGNIYASEILFAGRNKRQHLRALLANNHTPKWVINNI